MNGDDRRYTVEDPRPIAADAPYTFILPGTEELAAIGPGDLVKLKFRYEHQTQKWDAERMWVTVEGANEAALWGSLSNDPDEPTSPLLHGDRIEFERHHVLSIIWARPEAAPAAPAYREYWDRCLVDDCVLNDSEPVEYLYREEPDMAGKDDAYPDSGWRIRGRRGDISDKAMDERKATFIAIGTVLNQDDSWLHLIDEPVGSAFMRDFASGEYQAATPSSSEED